MTNIKKISDYYNMAEEDKRLSSAAGQLEYLRSKELLLRYIEKKPSKILDIGGGTGPYSFMLAEEGHKVFLIDLASSHIKKAKELSKEKQKSLSHIAVGDAKQLDFKDNMFDVVLMFGPLYHLTDQKDRFKALHEAKRVLKPGGILFAVGISQYASTMAGFFYNMIQDFDYIKIMNQDLVDGQHRNISDKLDYMTDAYFHHPLKLKEEIDQTGFKTKYIFAIEGFGWLIPDLENKWKNTKFQQLLLETLRKTEQESTILSVSAHIMIIAKL